MDWSSTSDEVNQLGLFERGSPREGGSGQMPEREDITRNASFNNPNPVLISDGPSPGLTLTVRATQQNNDLQNKLENLLSPKLGKSFRGWRTTRNFPGDASIVLIGIRGTGKSSLGILASSVLRRQLVDADQYFYRITGSSRAAYRRDNGASDYRACEVRVFRRMLTENGRHCIITCGPGCLEEDGRQFLREYAKYHPVIHILREQEAIQKYLKIPESSRIAHLLEISEPMYRACSNFEFYNLTEPKKSTEIIGGDSEVMKEVAACRNPPSTPFLALKHVEIDFVNFLNFIICGTPHQTTTKKPWSSHSYVSTEPGIYTYALQIPLSRFMDDELDIENIEAGVDAIELNIDIPDNVDAFYFKEYLSPRNISRQIARLRRKSTVPIIFSAQSNLQFTPLDTSATSNFELLYFDLLHYGLRLGVEYLVVDTRSSEEGIRGLLAERGLTKIIGHLSINDTGPGGWEGQERLEDYHRIRRLGCDIVRISQHASSMEDNFDMLRFRQQIDNIEYQHPPLISYNTGSVGRMSYCLSPFMTPVTHPKLRDSGIPGHTTMISAREAQIALYSNFSLNQMEFCTFGEDVSYSLSPVMFNAAAEACGIPHKWGVYESTNLKDLVGLFERENFGGVCVSAPFKIEVISLLQSMSSHARAIGAVNTIISIRELEDRALPRGLSLRAQRGRSGPFRAIYGDNTDWIGIRACIRSNLSPANAITRQTTGLVVGAGGMARATIYAMLQLGVQNIFISNRTYANAIKLAEHYNSQESIGPAVTSSFVQKPDGAISSEPQTRKHKVHVLKSTQEPWPDSYRQPTIIVCCIPPYSSEHELKANFTVPPQWFQSPTGGVVLEVRLIMI